MKNIVQRDFEFIPHYCKCPCNREIVLKKESINYYERRGYPKFIRGHSMKCLNIFVQGDFSFIPYFCACGCGGVVKLDIMKILKYEKYGYLRFIYNHREHFSEERKLKLSKSIKIALSNPKIKAIRDVKDKLPETKKNRSEAAKKLWKDSNFRELHSNIYHWNWHKDRDKLYALQREKREKFGNYSLNPCIGNGYRIIKGYQRHHVNKNDVIYVPKDYNQGIYHNLRKNFNMTIVNTLAYFFLVMNYIDDLNKIFTNTR